ncbi:DUF4262 domain-containing protein [Actinocatenispora sera]|uniref:DUF4262 domain-containing protein n=1 Tax=Actinocatenispora sera TaxID=390989 RepID=UPI0033E036A7
MAHEHERSRAAGVLAFGYVPHKPDVSRTWGRLAAAAQLRGRPRPMNDMWIAVTCIACGASWHDAVHRTAIANRCMSYGAAGACSPLPCPLHAGTALYDLDVNQGESLCLCTLCRDYGDTEERSPADLTTIEHVQQHGWSVMMVPADDQGPGWAYTIGLWHSYRMPEVAIFGLEMAMSHECLNNLGAATRDGTPLEVEQARADVIERYAVQLKLVSQGWHRAFFGQTIDFYRRTPIPFLQVVWPDRHGRFPWEPHSDEQVRTFQPQLWQSPKDHPVGVWTQDL